MAQILGENRLTCYGCKVSFVAGSPMMEGNHVICRSCPALRQIPHPERGDISCLHCRRPPKSDFLAPYLNICVWCEQEPFSHDGYPHQYSCHARPRRHNLTCECTMPNLQKSFWQKVRHHLRDFDQNYLKIQPPIDVEKL